MDDEKPARPLTPAQKRFLEAVDRIRANQPTFDDLAYMARELVQVTLPHRNPGDVPEWARSNGNLTLSIRPGWATDQKTGKRHAIGYPYGTLPRLLLFWLTAEAVAAKGRGDHSGRIELGSSLSDFMFQLGLDPSSRGPRSDARRLHDQMERLFNASISFESTRIEGGRRGDERINMAVASHVLLWWSPRDPSQAALWDSHIHLSREFFAAITAHPIPLDMRALKALKRSPLALDLYSWLTYEAYRAHKSGKGRFIAWKLLAEQMGGDYADVHDFQKKVRVALRKIQALYPDLKLGPLRGGIRIEPDSLPAITPRLAATVEHVEAKAPEPPVSEWEAMVRAIEGNSNVPAPLIDLVKSTPPQRHDEATRAYHKISALLDSHTRSMKAAGRSEQEVSEVIAGALVEMLRVYTEKLKTPDNSSQARPDSG